MGVHNKFLVKGLVTHVPKTHTSLANTGCEAEEQRYRRSCNTQRFCPSKSRVTYSDLRDNIQSSNISLIGVQYEEEPGHHRKTCFVERW